MRSRNVLALGAGAATLALMFTATFAAATPARGDDLNIDVCAQARIDVDNATKAHDDAKSTLDRLLDDLGLVGDRDKANQDEFNTAVLLRLAISTRDRVCGAPSATTTTTTPWTTTKVTTATTTATVTTNTTPKGYPETGGGPGDAPSLPR